MNLRKRILKSAISSICIGALCSLGMALICFECSYSLDNVLWASIGGFIGGFIGTLVISLINLHKM